MNDTTPAAGSEPERIDINQPDLVQAWAKRLDVTPEQIKEAIAAVGDRATDVELHLKGSRSTTNADQEKRAETLTPGR